VSASGCGDLHVHSALSDGSESVAAILEAAAQLALDFISITDHDTTAGSRDALELGGALGIVAIPGVEISAYDRARGRKAHLLGYSYDLSAPAITTFCEPILAARDELTRRQIDKLRRLGYPVSIGEVEEIAGPSAALYKQHVMELLSRRGSADGIYGATYRSLFKGGGPCDIEIDYPDVFEALEAIHADGGLAVLAHPGQQDSWELLEELAEAGLDGVELEHEDHGSEDHRRVLEAAARHPRLILAGGSDYHGSLGGMSALGEYLAPRASCLALSRRAPRRDPANARLDESSPRIHEGRGLS
jgi:predicted metal-dependent phosphoesterase TrpH